VTEDREGAIEEVPESPESFGRTDFRALNEHVRLLVSQFQEPASTELVAFACECRDAHCFASVEVTLSEYAAVCSDGAHRLIHPGHEHEGDEVVVLTPRYAVIRLAEVTHPQPLS
jgi:hypothetical protein